MDTVKEVKPFAPLRALTSHIVDPENHVLDVEFHLKYVLNVENTNVHWDVIYD